jgi:hypothetical protein
MLFRVPNHSPLSKQPLWLRSEHVIGVRDLGHSLYKKERYPQCRLLLTSGATVEVWTKAEEILNILNKLPES